MREIPIIYSAPMVLAKLSGRKSMTRRTYGLELINSEPERWQFIRTEVGKTPRGWLTTFALFKYIDGKEVWLPCPYGQPSDVLYCRENLRQSKGLISYAADDTWWKGAGEFHYRYEEYEGIVPSIHMPKVAARIWDEVIHIRVERLQDITEQDAVMEGIPESRSTTSKGMYHLPSARYMFQELWQSINGEESLKLNPWLWVVTTKNLSTTGKPDGL